MVHSPVRYVIVYQAGYVFNHPLPHRVSNTSYPLLDKPFVISLARWPCKRNHGLSIIKTHENLIPMFYPSYYFLFIHLKMEKKSLLAQCYW